MAESPTRDEFFRKVGRNLCLFQSVEQKLKVLAALSRVQFDPRIPARDQAHPFERVSRQTMGMLTNEVSRGLLSGAQASEPSAGSDEYFVWTTRLELADGLSESLRSDLVALVAERNALVHGATTTYDLESETSLEEGLRKLDAQRERILPVINTLRHLAIHTRDAMREMVEFFASDEFKALLHREKLARCLLDAVARAGRSDGWSPLAQVGQHWREFRLSLPETERASLPRLRDLLQDSGLFEWRDEPTATGGPITYCRLRPDRPSCYNAP